MWLSFLETENQSVCHPFIDLSLDRQALVLDFTSDASKNGELGFGYVFNKQWACGRWGTHYIRTCDPSIEYLELFGLMIAVHTWADQLANNRVVIF